MYLIIFFIDAYESTCLVYPSGFDRLIWFPLYYIVFFVVCRPRNSLKIN